MFYSFTETSEKNSTSLIEKLTRENYYNLL